MAPIYNRPQAASSELVVKWSKVPTAVVGRLDLSLSKECEGRVMVVTVGDGGFGHQRLMIVAVILNDCRSDPIVWWKIVLRDLITSE